MEINDNNIDELLPRVKETELEILSMVDAFCRKNNIKYSIAYGTMIGAIRHKGFIPWDDDIDIFMLREDYDRFILIWQDKHPEGFILENKDTNRNFTQSFTKIRKEHTTFLQSGEENAKYHTGIFIDVFPMDRVANSDFLQKINFINVCFYFLFCREFASDHDGKLMNILCKFILGIVPKKLYPKMRKKYLKRIIKYNDTHNQLVSYDTFGDAKIHFKSDLFDNITEVEFESHKYMCFNEYEEFLIRQYGDYMQLPPEEERVWKHHPILIDFEHNYDELREINNV